jgi:sulfur-oxidizing protein SoxY
MKFVQQVDITLNDERVLSMESDISLATDPAIGFRFVPRPADLPGKLKVTVRDSDNAVFEQSFDVSASGS